MFPCFFVAAPPFFTCYFALTIWHLVPSMHWTVGPDNMLNLRNLLTKSSFLSLFIKRL